MSPRGDQSDEQQSQQPAEASRGNAAGPPNARVRRTSWRGWIWAVPLAALILVAFLGVRNWVLTGPTITVRFPSAEGVNKGTPVQHKGVQVGSVDEVYLLDDLSDAVVTLSMYGSVSDHLRSDTQFWIVQPEITSGNLSNVLSGSYIAMEPGGGEEVREFEGQLRPPTIDPNEPGRNFVLRADRAEGITHGTPILYRGIEAGEVTGVSYARQRDRIRVDVFIREPFDQLVREQSLFWRCSGLDLSSQDGGFGLDMPPLPRLLEGCIAFHTPTDQAAELATAESQFRLYGSEEAARTAPTGDAVPFVVHFPGSVEGLEPGAPVKLKGIRVGRVRDVSLVYEPEQQEVATPVTLEIEPARLGLPSDVAATGQSTEPLYQAVAQLTQRGLRAQLSSSNLLLGSKQVALVVMDEPPAQEVDIMKRPMRIPAVGGGDLGSVVASVGRLVDQANAVPIRSIGENLERLTGRLERIAASPELSQSIERLNQAAENVQRITSEAQGEVQPTLQSLREAADAAGSAASTLNRVTGGSLRSDQDIEELVGELTKAARSVRLLADYLNRHPEALLQGRSPE